MKVGFTGTKFDMTAEQNSSLQDLLGGMFLGSDSFHHGDSVGADRVAHLAAKQEGYWVVAHPGYPNNPSLGCYRAFCSADEVREAAPFLVRNHHIVDETDVLVVVPFYQVHAHCRHGECATARYAWSLGKRVVYILRDGGVYDEGP